MGTQKRVSLTLTCLALLFGHSSHPPAAAWRRKSCYVAGLSTAPSRSLLFGREEAAALLAGFER